MVRTRIAPSPTGYPHIGTIYQVLFDYAFAKKNQGKFLIRIEDTDRERFVADAEEKLYQALDWFGLTEDESPRLPGKFGPYRQSERLPLYKKYAQVLLDNGHAYYCFCTKERLDQVRENFQKQELPPMYDKHCRFLKASEVKEKLKAKTPYVIRLKVPEHATVTVQDGIRGDISFSSDQIDDQVLIKSDGFPTYHLAVVVDDHLMEITHVVRGEEWISSFPKHKLLYDYFHWQLPLFFHTPVLRNPDKSKLSKRHGHTSVSWYRENGYLPEAILNFLALLGWSHPQGKEIFSLEEFTQLFDLKDLKPIGPIFDLTKLAWLNGEYIRKSPNAYLKTQIYKFYQGKYSQGLIEKVIPIIKERIQTLKDIDPLIDFFVNRPTVDVNLLVPKKRSLDESKKVLQSIIASYEKVSPWTAAALHEEGNKLVTETAWKPVELFQMIRIALSGKTVTPPLFESMEILGKEECLSRLRALRTS